MERILDDGAPKRATCHDGMLSPERFEIVLSSISDGVFAVDQRRRITCFNRAAAVSFGISRDEAIGRR